MNGRRHAEVRPDRRHQGMILNLCEIHLVPLGPSRGYPANERHRSRDDHVDCGLDNSLLLGDTDLSFAIWFKMTELAGTNYLVGTYSVQNGKYYHIWEENGLLRWSIDDNVVKSQIESSPIEAGQWYQAVGVREQGKEIRLYVNGALAAAGADQTGDITSDSPMFFGDRFAGERALEGVIDEVALYNRALTDDEILNNYNAETGPFSVAPAGKLSLTWGKIKVSL